ncbi:hypothetical protein CIB84_002267, partial [Bambusicola thoracicus]
DKSIIHLSVHVFQVYLADYGLSYRYCPNGNHKQYQENPRKGHNGTIEFTSIDAHKGVGRLMDELPDSVMEWNSSGSSCTYDEKPKYQELKKILLDGLEMSGIPYDGPLEFSTAGCTQNHCAAKASKVRLPKPMPKPAQRKQKKMESEENICQNKACTGGTGRLLQDEEKPSNLNRTLPQTEPQQVHLPKPSPSPAKQKQKMKEDASKYPSRPQAQITHRKSHAEEKPMKLNSTVQETDRQKYSYTCTFVSNITFLVFSLMLRCLQCKRIGVPTVVLLSRFLHGGFQCQWLRK